MAFRLESVRRGVAALLVVVHAAFALGAGAHAGSHVDPDVAWLPADLHHHSYGWGVTSPEPPASLDPCVACQLTRLTPRLPATVFAPVPTADPADEGAPLDPLLPAGPRPDTLGPRAPPIA